MFFLQIQRFRKQISREPSSIKMHGLIFQWLDYNGTLIFLFQIDHQNENCILFWMVISFHISILFIPLCSVHIFCGACSTNANKNLVQWSNANIGFHSLFGGLSTMRSYSVVVFWMTFQTQEFHGIGCLLYNDGIFRHNIAILIQLYNWYGSGSTRLTEESTTSLILLKQYSSKDIIFR